MSTPSEPADPARDIDLDAFRSGEEFKAVLEKFGRLIYSVAKHYSGGDEDDEEEMYQLACIRIYERCSTFRGGSLAAWIYRTTDNFCQNWVRDRKAREAATERYAVAHPNGVQTSGAPTDPWKHMVRVELRRRIGEALVKLGKRQRDAFVLTQVEGHSTKEAARIMGMGDATVRSNLRHAKEKLREELKDLMEER